MLDDNTSAAQWVVPGVPFSAAADSRGSATPGASAAAPARSSLAPSAAGAAAPSSAADPVAGADIAALVAAVEESLAVVPSILSSRVAVVRAEALLVLQERVGAAALRAVADVEERGLWRERQAGSTRTWLRTLPCGDTGQLALGRLVEDRPVLGRAFADGQVSARTFGAVARELARVPVQVDPEQLSGVLIDGLGDVMRVWAGAACLDPTPEQEQMFDARREQLARVVRQGLTDTWSDAAGKLEPAFTLAATVLPPAEVVAGVKLLVDALQPEAQADDAAEQAYRARGLTLRKLRTGGWSLRAHLTDEVGQHLHDELVSRDPDSPAAKARVTRQQAAPDADGVTVEEILRPDAADQPGEPGQPGEPSQHADPAAISWEGTGGEEGGDGDEGGEAERIDVARVRGTPTEETDADASGRYDSDSADDTGRFGTAGAGVDPDPFGHPEESTPLVSRDQRAHDAFAQLLADLTTCTAGTGTPAPSHLTIIAGLDALEDRPGAPPGRLHTSRGDVLLTPGQLRRHVCGSLLSAVLTDARRRPVAASGDHRHATPRERRAMRAAWGSTCSVNGCALTGTVPHHAEPWWKTQQTVLKDLVPLCEHHHHDVHDGSKTLRLRDGRSISEWGWA